MTKLIKLSDIHYIVIDVFEKPLNGDYFYNTIDDAIYGPAKGWEILFDENEKIDFKITHSTQPDKGMENVTFISLSEVEEALYGYNVQEMAFESVICNGGLITTENETEVAVSYYYQGFKAHQELVKDKLFTVEDMRKVLKLAWLEGYDNKLKISKNTRESFEDNLIQSLLPKTEWNIEFDEQGKIKLI